MAMLPLFLVLFLFPLLIISSTSSSPPATTLPGCPSTCGNMTIPFPFGIKPGCHLPGFFVNCKNSSATISPISGEVEISSISLFPAEARILTPIIRNCVHSGIANSTIDFSNLPFSISSRNKFTAIGCDALALYAISNSRGTNLDYASGCLSFCNSLEGITNGSCNGGGCCQTAIKSGLHSVSTSLGTIGSTPSNSTECNHAFFVENERFEFSLTYLTDFSATVMPMVLNWAIMNGTCSPANNTCGMNADCSDSFSMSGYVCSCKEGFSGNPYLENGCDDINECADPNKSPCSGICRNTRGNYECSCPGGFSGDGAKSGTGCTKVTKRFPLVNVIIGTGLGFLFLLLAGTYLFWAQKKHKLLSLKEKFFQKNGGLLLQQQISTRHGHSETARIYTAQELNRATDNYSDARILGRGGNGTVYKGVFPDRNLEVAIKKSRCVDGSQIEPFINEVVLLSQVIHKHVVRILGCCLETQVPLLVYEYISNDTLHHHLHVKPGSLSWDVRLRIAAETAGALAYLHSAIERPIFHRDIKSANILLDDNFMAKVADFGASRLVPLDRVQVTTMVQGTLGYLDPEYFQTGQLTEKSDVYSFGVVMAEILTGEKPISSMRMAVEKNLGVYIVTMMKEGRLMESLEGRVRKEGGAEQLLLVAELARRCLCMNGEDRPTMREVAAELEAARRWSVGKSLSASPARIDAGDWTMKVAGFKKCGESMDFEDGFCDSPAVRECDSLLFDLRNCNSSGPGSTADSLDSDGRTMTNMMTLNIQR